MSRTTDLALTALAPAIWGSTYIVATELLTGGNPITIAMLRALPAGLLLLLFVRQLPPLRWLGKIAILGALNFALFWSAINFSAYALPGGVAATLGAVQPLIVLAIASSLLGTHIPMAAIGAALLGMFGVALLILGPEASLNPAGVIAALIGAVSMATGVVLTRKWQPEVSPLTFTAWQLTAGGLLLLPVALVVDPGMGIPSTKFLVGLLWMGLVSAAFTYFLWFRGIARLGPATVTGFGFLSPLSAVILGWLVLGQNLTWMQWGGAAIIAASVWGSQRAMRPKPAENSSALAKAA